MTTSYELSLKLKELGVEQNGGEYYWVITLEDETVRYDKTQVSQMWEGEIIRCRALTLGEMVRELKDVDIWVENDYWKVADCNNGSIYKSIISPEEAAGELLAAIKEQEKQKA